MDIEDSNFRGSASGELAVSSLLELAKEKEKTKRFLLLAACFMFLVGCAFVIFAPDGKETVSYLVSGALTIISLGAIGVSSFKLKTPVVEVAASEFVKGEIRRQQNFDGEGGP
ncbi:hypothetical protein R50072_11320 [Simiduia litorea]|uniref:hypothetical protein n=1 Tax=Simiduia litorea TaxID=1435348 RepID=UPI0036F4382D